MTKDQVQQEALSNARNNESMRNYPAIYEGFTSKGIPESDIIPRVNIFTYQAWRALGRQVNKGEHGVKISTFVPMTKKDTDDEGNETKSSFKRARRVTVFHVSQTSEVE